MHRSTMRSTQLVEWKATPGRTVSAKGEPGPPERDVPEREVPEREVPIASGIFSTVFELVARVVPGLLYPNSDSSTVLVLEMVLYVDRAMRGAWRDGETRGTRAGVSAWTRGIPRGVGGCARGRRCRGSTPAGTVPHAERTQSPPPMEVKCEG